jgi:hypothetical protein
MTSAATSTRRPADAPDSPVGTVPARPPSHVLIILDSPTRAAPTAPDDPLTVRGDREAR